MDDFECSIYQPLRIRDIYNIIGYKVGFELESELMQRLQNEQDADRPRERDMSSGLVMVNGAIIILLNDTEDIGHWVTVTQNNEQICYFDPYGELPPDWLKPYITNYMNKSIQASRTSACGYHCGLFIRNFWMSEDQYRSLFDGIKSPTDRDRFVVDVCNKLMECNGYDYHS
jgi:hypothetical protein